jgi:hypothetical protein
MPRPRRAPAGFQGVGRVGSRCCQPWFTGAPGALTLAVPASGLAGGACAAMSCPGVGVAQRSGERCRSAADGCRKQSAGADGRAAGRGLAFCPSRGQGRAQGCAAVGSARAGFPACESIVRAARAVLRAWSCLAWSFVITRHASRVAALGSVFTLHALAFWPLSRAAERERARNRHHASRTICQGSWARNRRGRLGRETEDSA